MATENSGGTLGNLRPWRPGTPSPNPGGRPKGLAARVRAQTDDGAELVDFMLNVLRGRRKAPLRLRMEAAAWLADRGFGKVSQPLEHTGEGGGPLRLTFRIAHPLDAPPPDPLEDQGHGRRTG